MLKKDKKYYRTQAFYSLQVQSNKVLQARRQKVEAKKVK